MNKDMVNSMVDVLAEVQTERLRQNVLWGIQDHADNTFPLAFDEDTAKRICEKAFREGKGSWAHILFEEFCEVMCAKTVGDMREELIQLAAVATQWVEAIDRR